MRRLYLGVDGGQSSTKALIADGDGNVLGRGTGGPCNHVKTDEGRERFARAISECLRQACAEARLDAAAVTFSSVCLGLSGGHEEKRAFAIEVIRAERYKLTHDAEIALVGATAGQPGIIVIAGTGSIAFGRNSRGRVARAGGWGYIFGDEGSGFDISRRALRACLREDEGWGPQTALRSALLNATGAADSNALLHLFYSSDYPRHRIAAFAGLVDEVAERGDAVAAEILRECGAALAVFAAGVFGTLFMPGENIPVAYVGNAFRSTLLLSAFRNAVAAIVACDVVAPRMSPVAGATLEAMRADGIEHPQLHVPESE